MPLFVNKNVSPGSGDKDSTSNAADELDVSGLPESAGTFGAFRGFGTPPGPDDPVPESVPTPPDGFDPSGGDGSGGGPGPVIAVTSGGVTFNLTFDSFAPASFRAGIQQAASILTSMISDQITVNLAIHYTGTGGGANAGPSGGLFESYAATTAALINHASLGDTIFSALPGGSSIQGQSQVAVWNAQLKALGFLSPTATASDGTANFATDINSNLLVGVALHELTHAMGRVPYGTGVDVQGRPDIFDLFRFTSAGTRLFTGSATSAAAAYFSVNGGSTKLADYGRTSDTSDFLNSGTQGGNDPFNEFYTSSTSQQLSTADLLQLDALGFHLTGYAPTAVELSGSTSIYHSSVNNSYYLVPAGTSSGAQPQLRFSGAGVTTGQFGPWSPIGAEHSAGGGYSVVWKMSGADQYTVWNTDGSGNYASQTPIVTSASWYVQSLEQSFGQDLNGDGRLGPVTANVETVGATTLAQVADSYFLYATGGSSGPQLRYAGAYVAAGQFGPWTPLGAEHNASGGYSVAWKMSGANQYTVWTTDSSGTYTSQTPVVTSASWYVQSIEQSFNQDLNGDGRLGPLTANVEILGSTTLAQVADSYFLYAHNTIIGPQLRYLGAYAAAGQFGAWAAFAAEQTASGYEVAWRNGGADQYLVWNTDSSGNWLSQTGVMSAFSATMELLEPSFHQDLNGDGVTGAVTTTIEASGATSLLQVGINYLFGSVAGPQLKLSGGSVAVGQFGAWTPLGAEQTAGGYQIVWKNGSADQYIVWTTDGNGNFLSQGAVLSGTSLALESLEPTFGQDLNGDLAIGVVAVGIESVGVTDLVKLANTYSLNAHGAPTGQQLKLSGAAVTVGQFGLWTPLGVELIAGNYQVVWKNGGADQYILWNADSGGNFFSQGTVLSGTSLALESLEATFHQDFNSDGTTGVVTTVTESFGATTLDQVANTYSLYAHGTTAGPQLKLSGAAVTVGQFGAWTPLGAEHNASGGYTIVWKNGGADQYVVWTTDSTGNYLSQGAVVSGASWSVQSLETSFNQNLNSDGIIGPTVTPIESSGSTTLTKVADSYFMNYGSSGPQVRFGGTYVAAGQFGAWTPIGAEQTASGYQVAWKNGGNDQYVVWNTDSSGNFLSQSAVVTGASPTVRSLESGFNQDLNGNGVIGSVTSMMSSSDSAAEVGPVTSGTLALLTNYMASAFAPPAGQSAGAIAATQSSDQDFLAKPHA